jgi:transcriptional regulator with XRE-family HTH domain
VRDQTQAQVARAVGIDASYYSKIESGSVRATPDIAKRLEEHFGHAISRMQILYPEDYPATPPQTRPLSRSP